MAESPLIQFRTKDYIKEALDDIWQTRGDDSIRKIGTEIFERWLIDNGYVEISAKRIKKNYKKEKQNA